MDRQQTQKTRTMVDLFISEYVLGKLRSQDVSFQTFLATNFEWNGFCLELEEIADREACSRDALIYDSMTDTQRRNIGVLFKESPETEHVSHDNYLDDLIKRSQPYKEFQQILPYLTKDEREALLKQLTHKIVDSLPSDEQSKYSPFTVKRYMLNLGFVQMARGVSYQPACEVILKYPALFRGIPQVVDRIVDRYIEEKVMSTPADKTKETLTTLRREIRGMYKELDI